MIDRPGAKDGHRFVALARLHAGASLLAILCVVLLAACGGAVASDGASLLESSPGEPTATTAPAAERLRVALVMKTLTNPFFVEMEKGARRAEQELGIDLIVKTGAQETSIEQQISIVDEFIAQQVDAIVIAPGSSTELIPVLKKAQDAGIVVINIDNRLDADLSAELGLTGVPFISVDNEEGAYLSARCIAERLDAPAEVAILEGIREARNAQDRKAGAARAFAETEELTVVASESANWKIDEAYAVTRKLLQEHPDVKGIFAANDMMALGVLKYLADSDITDISVAGFDALSEALTAIDEGALLCTVDQQPAEQGYLGVQFAVRATNGETLPAEVLVDVRLIQGE